MQLSKLKKIVFGAGTAVISMIPIGKFMQLYIQNYKISRYLQDYNHNIEMQNMMLGANTEDGLTYPTSPEEYDKWAAIAPIEDVEKFNGILADIKASGTLSDAFLQTQGYESTEAFVAFLTSLYEAGKNGDVAAQEQFNSLYQEYQNDFFNQAVAQFGDGLGASTTEFVPETVSDGGGILDDLPVEMMLFIGGGIVIGMSIATIAWTQYIKKKDQQRELQAQIAKQAKINAAARAQHKTNDNDRQQ